MTNVSIGGNVEDSVLVFGNNNYVVKIGDVNGGMVNIVKPSDKPKFSARPAPVMVKPRAFPSLLNRERELETVKNAVQKSIPVSIWGQGGIGKTAFVRHLIHSLDEKSFPNGVVFLDASNHGLEDLLQALFDLFFDSAASYKPTVAEITQALQPIKALIFIDDIQIGRDEAPSLLDAAPNSLFILSSRDRSLWGEGESISIQGLPENETIKLFEKELSRALTDAEKPVVAKICATLKGHPLQILQAASLARNSVRPIDNIQAEVANEKEENKTLAYMGMALLNDAEKQILALLAAAGGTIVSLDHIKGIFKNGNEQNNLQRLVSLGLVQSHSPKFSIGNAAAASISAAWDLTTWQDTLLSYAINWLSQQPASMLVDESSGLLIHTLKEAGERKKWREVIQLGRALEKFMVLYKRWQAWSDILNLILTAAKALNESNVQAWALHQLGSRALYLGHTAEAQNFLSQALKIRQAIGDKAGAALTQHNMNTLRGIVAPVKEAASGCRKYLKYGCGTLAGLAILAVAAWFAIPFFTPPATTPTRTPRPRPTNTSAPAHVSSPTPTQSPTKTPHPTSTPIPPPEILFDFIEHANEAVWFTNRTDPDGSITSEMKFFEAPMSPSPEDYLIESSYPYAGWDFETPLMSGDFHKQVLLTYPYYEYSKVFGEYEVDIPRSAPEAYLELTAGYKDKLIEPVRGFVFRVYMDGELLIEAPYKFGSAPIRIGEIIALSEGIHLFRLEVESLAFSPYDFAAWAVVKLWDGKP